MDSSKEDGKSDRKESPSSAAAAKAGPPEQAPKCPRCDSPNTKFCYYNNYSLTQPRHFCKTCRRYWTKGGALRNVPIGGGCRKNKKGKSSSRISGDSRDSSSSSELGGFKFFHGLAPAMDFQLGGLNFPKFTPPPAGILGNQYSSFGDSASSSVSPSIFNLDPPGGNFLGFNYSNPYGGGGGANLPEMAAMNLNSNLASSIESLSSINQDLHWKLQQQRLGVLFGENSKQNDGVLERPQPQIPQPILFQNLEGSRKGGESEAGTAATEWFFGNSYAAPPVATPTPTNSGGNGGNENNGNWSGVPGWSNDLHHHQYNNLP